MKAFDIVCFGEPLFELSEIERNGERLMLPGFGGDTMNVAVAAARQDARVAVFTALGDDIFGQRFLSLWDSEAIARSDVIVRAGGQTGLYFITHGETGHEFTYARGHSAASRITPAEVPTGLIASSRLLHLSGITQAISDDACDAAFAAIAAARKNGVMVSYDTNLRLRLWPLSRARAIIHEAVRSVDIVRPSLDDARLLTGREDMHGIADFYLECGPKMVVLTLGRNGCLVATPEGRTHIAGIRADAVDGSGAGDTFTGAFLARYLENGDMLEAAHHANLAAALQTTKYGAVAAIPHKRDVLLYAEWNIAGDRDSR